MIEELITGPITTATVLALVLYVVAKHTLPLLTKKEQRQHRCTEDERIRVIETAVAANGARADAHFADIKESLKNIREDIRHLKT